MKFFEGMSIINFSWSEVAQGVWQRYPNPHSCHVLSEDTIYRKVVNSKLYSKRLLTKTNRLPKWGSKFVNAKKVSIVEESVVDPVRKEVCTYTRNIGMSKVMSIVEKVTYRENPENPTSTTVERQAWIESQIYGFSYAIQKLGIDRYKKNITKANEGFHFVLQNLFPRLDGAILHNPDYHQRLKDSKARISNVAKETAQKAKEIAQEKRRPNYST